MLEKLPVSAGHVVALEHAERATLVIDDDRGGDPLLVEEGGGVQGQQVGADRVRVSTHDLLGFDVEWVVRALEQAPDVAVGDDADECLAVEHGRHALALGCDLCDHVAGR